MTDALASTDGFFDNLDGMVEIKNPGRELFKMCVRAHSSSALGPPRSMSNADCSVWRVLSHRYVPDIKGFFEVRSFRSLSTASPRALTSAPARIVARLEARLDDGLPLQAAPHQAYVPVRRLFGLSLRSVERLALARPLLEAPELTIAFPCRPEFEYTASLVKPEEVKNVKITLAAPECVRSLSLSPSLARSHPALARAGGTTSGTASTPSPRTCTRPRSSTLPTSPGRTARSSPTCTPLGAATSSLTTRSWPTLCVSLSLLPLFHSVSDSL